MEVHKRRQAILALLEEHGEVRIEELSDSLQVSANTVRNDLSTLEEEKLLRRVRGGAVTFDGGGGLHGDRLFSARVKINQVAKERMGRWAASLVKDGDAIVLDASSTVYHIATCLGNRRDLTVVTNGLEAALLLARNPSNKVILAANLVNSDGLTLVGSLHPDLLAHFNASKCFITCSGLSVERGFTEADVDEANLQTQMMKLAGQVIALVDHTKFGKVDTYRFAGLDQVHHLITDRNTDIPTVLRGSCTFPITVVGASSVTTLEPGRTGPDKRRYRIGFGNMTEKMVFARQVRRSLQRALQHLDNVELFVRDNNLDAQTTLENAEWFVANQMDLVIEYQIDARVGNIIMDRFNQADIPVIAVDIPLPGATFFGADNYRAGYMAGEGLGQWIKENWTASPDVLLRLESSRVGPLGGARLQGQQDGLQALIGPIPDEKVASADSPVIFEEAETFVEDLLPSLSGAARVAIIAINDDAALGALAAFEKAERLSQVAAVGQNADRLGRNALRRPDFPFIGSTRYAPEQYGARLLDLALSILDGKAVPPAVYNEHVFITKDNIDKYYPLSEESRLLELLGKEAVL